MDVGCVSYCVSRLLVWRKAVCVILCKYAACVEVGCVCGGRLFVVLRK